MGTQIWYYAAFGVIALFLGLALFLVAYMIISNKKASKAPTDLHSVVRKAQEEGNKSLPTTSSSVFDATTIEPVKPRTRNFEPRRSSATWNFAAEGKAKRSEAAEPASLPTSRSSASGPSLPRATGGSPFPAPRSAEQAGLPTRRQLREQQGFPLPSPKDDDK